MTPELPLEIRSLVEAIEQRTTQLVEAAGRHDVAAVQDELQSRADLVDDLEVAVRRFRDGAGAQGTALLAAERTRLERSAAQALEGLDRLRRAIGNASADLERQNAALRSYAGRELPAAGLDRAG